MIVSITGAAISVFVTVDMHLVQMSTVVKVNAMILKNQISISNQLSACKFANLVSSFLKLHE